MKTKRMQVWEVRFYWDGRDAPSGTTHEAGLNTSFPVGTPALRIICDVAAWREVDLGRVHTITCERVGDPYEEQAE